MADLGKRTNFWKLLLESDVWVVSDSTSDTNLVLHVWSSNDEDTCPIFTSYSLLKNVMGPGTPFVQINAKIIFQSMVDGRMGAFINPRYDGQVRLRSRDLVELLAGRFETVHGSDA